MSHTTHRMRQVAWLIVSVVNVGCSSTTGNPTGKANGGAGAVAGTSHGSGNATTGGSEASVGGAVAKGGSSATAGGSEASVGGAVAKGGASATAGGSEASVGGAVAKGGASTGGAGSTVGGAVAKGGAFAATGGAGSTAGGASACNSPALVWKTANKTNYTSYPDPGSAECIQYNGCTWAGQFAACNDTKPEAWVRTHDIVAVFPNFQALKLHDLCLRRGSSSIVVTVIDTCGDSDCGGCCTENKGTADALIDIESYTDARWGVPDGPIEWADLGPTQGSGCN